MMLDSYLDQAMRRLVQILLHVNNDFSCSLGNHSLCLSNAGDGKGTQLLPFRSRTVL